MARGSSTSFSRWSSHSSSFIYLFTFLLLSAISPGIDGSSYHETGRMSMSALFPLSDAQWVTKWKVTGPYMSWRSAEGGAGEIEGLKDLSYWHLV